MVQGKIGAAVRGSIPAVPVFRSRTFSKGRGDGCNAGARSVPNLVRTCVRPVRQSAGHDQKHSGQRQIVGTRLGGDTRPDRAQQETYTTVPARPYAAHHGQPARFLEIDRWTFRFTRERGIERTVWPIGRQPGQ
jgi:hypothetical protein